MTEIKTIWVEMWMENFFIYVFTDEIVKFTAQKRIAQLIIIILSEKCQHFD